MPRGLIITLIQGQDELESVEVIPLSIVKGQEKTKIIRYKGEGSREFTKNITWKEVSKDIYREFENPLMSNEELYFTVKTKYFDNGLLLKV